MPFPVDPSNLPTGDHIEAARPVVKVVAYLLGLVGLGWLLRGRIDSHMQEHTKKIAAAEIVADSAKRAADRAIFDSTAILSRMDELEDKVLSEYVSKNDLSSIQSKCVANFLDRVLLLLEERDRKRDHEIHEKISSVCKHISDLSKDVAVLTVEVRRMHGKRSNESN